MKFQIISDGSCDLSDELIEKHKIRVVPFYVSFDSETYLKEREEISVRDFYQRMIDQPKVFPKSSLPSIQNYMDAFLPYIEADTPIICICITSKFSGSYNSACNARDILLEDYPDAKISVIDSTVDTVLQGILVMESARMQAADCEYLQVVEAMETLKPSGRIFFTIGSIEYLKKGGRLGKLASIAAATLGIRPLIQLKEGEIFPFGISRSRSKSMAKVITQVLEHFEKQKEKFEHYSIVVGYGYSYDEAVEFRHTLVDALHCSLTEEDIPLYQIGATIAVHTGPEPIGVGLVRRYDAPAQQTAESESFFKPAFDLASQTAHKASQTAQNVLKKKKTNI